MAIWASYQITTADTDLVVTVDWRTTQNGAVIKTDVKRYSLVDPAVVGRGAPALADQITRDFQQRARQIDHGVQVYTAVQGALSQPQNTVFQVIP